MVDIGDKIKTLLDYTGENEESLARYIESSVDAHCTPIKEYISGESAPSLETFVVLCDFFGVSADYLLGRGVSGVVDNAVEYKKILDLLEEIREVLN